MNNNKKLLKDLSSSVYDFVCSYREHSNWYFYDNEIPSLDYVEKMFSDEDKGVDFMSEFSDMFYNLTSQKDFSNNQDEKFFDQLCSIFKNYNKFLNNYEKENSISDLAWKLVDYAKDTDHYEFYDNYESEEVAFNHISNDLLSKEKTEQIITYFCNEVNIYVKEQDLTDKETLNNYNKASDLLKELNIYSKTFEKENSYEEDIEL